MSTAVSIRDFSAVEMIEDDCGGVTVRVWDGDDLLVEAEAADRASIRYFLSERAARWMAEHEPDIEHNFTFSGSRLALECEDVLSGLAKPRRVPVEA